MLLAKFQASDNKTWPDSTLILGDKGETLEFEKLSDFLNLLDFQLLSQQVLSRVVVILMDCMIFVSPFLDIRRMSMSTVSFLTQLDSAIICL